MTATTRAAFQTSLTTTLNDNTTGQISAADTRTPHIDHSDSTPFFGEDIGGKGFASTAFDAGTKTSGTFTPVPASGNIQKAVNGGAHTLAPPAVDTCMCIRYTNNASAGAITTSGFTKKLGDTITTTNGDNFMFDITRIGSFSRLVVTALQ